MKITSLLILFVLPTNLGITQNVHNLLGNWKGILEKDQQQWGTEINFFLGDNGLQALVNYPDYGLYNLKIDSMSVSDTAIALYNQTAGFKFEGLRQKNNIKGYWEGLGKKASFSIKKNSKWMMPFRQKEISFTSKEALLSGTLILPEGKGPYPAVVQVHGSGNQTRTEDFYRSRAYLLAKNGIAVLIYDRRGKGSSSGKDVTMDLLAEDAVAAVNYLLTYEWIDKNSIGIIGFSQGGYVAPLAASKSKDISFLVVGSAPGITPDEQNNFNVLNRLKRQNVSTDSINYVKSLRKDVSSFQYFGTGDIQNIEERIHNIQHAKWFRQTLLPTPPLEKFDSAITSFLLFDPLPVWQKIKIPCLLMWGEMDELVPAGQSKTDISISLILAGNKNFEARIFPGAGHGLAEVSPPDRVWHRLTSGYHELLVNWIRNQ